MLCPNNEVINGGKFNIAKIRQTGTFVSDKKFKVYNITINFVYNNTRYSYRVNQNQLNEIIRINE